MELDKKLHLAMNNAYCLLRSRPRSEHEMRSRLKLKRYDQTTIDAVIESLKKISEIDDVKFVNFWVESRMHVNPAGDRLLKRELQTKGIPEPIIDAALDEKAKNYDEYSVVLKIAEKQYKGLTNIDGRKARKKIYDRLLRRGFGYDVVERAVNAVMNEDR